MREGRSRDNWRHTSNLMALLANCHRDEEKRGQPWHPEDFDPHAPAGGEEAGERWEDLPELPIDVLKVLFVDRQSGGNRGG